MYPPKAFEVTDPEELFALIAAGGLAHLVTATDEGLVASVVPMLLDRQPGTAGVLLGHVARTNPHWQAAPTGESLAIFAGPNAYVSPSSYPTKLRTGEVVPTWNYVTVHVYGDLFVHDDPAWVGDLVTRLTDRHESRRTAPWAVSDAPAPFVQRQLRAVVGIELAISRLRGIRKLSQNRPPADVAGVVTAFSAGTPTERAVAEEMRRIWSQGSDGGD